MRNSVAAGGTRGRRFDFQWTSDWFAPMRSVVEPNATYTIERCLSDIRVGSHVVFAWIHCTDVRIHCTDILIECR